MGEETSPRTWYGDLGLVGVGVFLALALIMAAAGAAPQPGSAPARGDDGVATGPAGTDGTEDAVPAGTATDDGSDAADASGHGHDHPDEGASAPSGSGESVDASRDGHAHPDAHVGGDTATATGTAQGATAQDEHGAHEAEGNEATAHDDADHDGHDAEAHDDADHDGHDAEAHSDAAHDGGDGDHGDGEHDHAAMRAGCDEDHPETRQIVSEVQHSLEHLYPDVATLIAQGYIPYFDAQIPLGLATEGMGHWLNPDYIDDGVMLDPTKPEAVLTDELYQPIGVMFIEDADDEGPPVYQNDDGTECSPWHPHTDVPARFSWWFYRQAYDGAAYNDGETAIPEVTPAMMHVWAVEHHESVYAHGPPSTAGREGVAGHLDDLPGPPLPTTPLDDAVPELGGLPLGPELTCPHCPEGGDGHDHEGGDGSDEDEEDTDAAEATATPAREEEQPDVEEPDGDGEDPNGDGPDGEEGLGGLLGGLDDE